METLPARALVTGGAGFIGSRLSATLLDRDVDVTVLDHLQTHDETDVPTGADLVVGDIRNDTHFEDLLPTVDVVFHQAGLVSVNRSVEAPQESHAVNTDATLDLLEQARAHDVRVIIASSSAIYGQPNQTPIDETHPIQPTSPYGLDKATIDRYARLYHELYGLETVSLRYFNVFGPGQPAGDYGGVISIFREQAQAGGPITVDGDGSQTRDFVHVDDVVQANLLAAQTEHTGEAFNIGTGSETSIQELAELIRELTDTDVAITYTDARSGDITQSVADIEKARTKLGYEPTISVRAGLAAMLDN